jgi:NADH-quinone oxidoreductase subunit L
MEKYLQLFIFIPLIGFLLSSILPQKNESVLSKNAFVTVGFHTVSIVVFTIYWLYRGFPTLNYNEIVLFKSTHFQFFVDFYFDKISAVYIIVGAIITFLVVVYSRYYMHRESGYKRYFTTMLLFYLGYNIIVLAGNLETLFIGWEILGLSSFLLIAFYRERYLPVKNAIKVFSIYRLGDVGMILAAWAFHHFWHENITFLKLHQYAYMDSHIEAHSLFAIFISLMIIFCAAVKSAQFPFSYWLPRAMEGPTPSSAIFYGSLSVHIGIFLLLRTYPFWEHQIGIRVFIGLIGLTTSVITNVIARVQSSIKSQIAYASISQIGIIFIEVALGLETLALFHFAANALFRTYQLLVSPSVVSYLIREQFYNFSPRPLTFEDSLPKRIENSFYILSLKEWNLDALVYKFYWNPLKWAGEKLNFLTLKGVFMFFIPVYLIGLYFIYNKLAIPSIVLAYLPFTCCVIGLLMILKAFSERKSIELTWILIIMNHFWVALGIGFNDTDTDFTYIYIYLSGVIVSGLLGYIILKKIRSYEPNINLDQYHGHSFKHPKLSFIFLFACLGLTSFPITPTFVGEDLIFSHINEHQVVLASVVSLAFVIDGIALIRMYAKLFLGPHINSPNEMSYKSA